MSRGASLFAVSVVLAVLSAGVIAGEGQPWTDKPFIDSGEIRDAKTIVALLLARLRLQGE